MNTHVCVSERRALLRTTCFVLLESPHYLILRSWPFESQECPMLKLQALIINLLEFQLPKYTCPCWTHNYLSMFRFEVICARKSIVRVLFRLSMHASSNFRHYKHVHLSVGSPSEHILTQEIIGPAGSYKKQTPRSHRSIQWPMRKDVFH